AAAGVPAGPERGRQPEPGIEEDEAGRQCGGAQPRAVQALIADLAAAQLRAAPDAATLADVVDHPRVRQAGDLPAQRPGAPAPVDLLAVHEVAAVEQADLAHRHAGEHHAGPFAPTDFRAQAVLLPRTAQ